LGGVQLRVVGSSPATPKAAPPPSPTPTTRPAASPSPPPPTAKAPTSAAPPPPRPSGGVISFVFTIKDGPTCRNWDDFLTVSAHRWSSLREELTSGRLAAFLASIQRQELAPDPNAPGSPDERLDAWLAGLPTTKQARPELDVHPAKLALKATPGGGLTRKKVQITNTGYRLLKATARVEP